MEDRYEIREKIGQGGIGSVHRAYDHKMKRLVAIKRILTSCEDPTLEGEATKQMLTEVRALASLQHPHIVTIYDVGEDEEGPYVVMELIDGKTLDETVEDAPLTWHDFRIVAMHSLEALIAAQELNMIHSDLKPPNIMLTRRMPSGAFQVKIVDFGLATLIHNQSQEEIENMEAIWGSIFFVPPEQYERKTLDTRSDLYSLGCCFYQALAGAYPFDGTTGMEVMQAHLNHTVKPIQDIRNDIPSWACDWVMWLINRFPDDRPNSAREALANFEQCDKETQPVVSHEKKPSGVSPRLLVPGSPATGPIPVPSKTTVVQAAASPTAIHSLVTAGGATTAVIHSSPAAHGQPKPRKRLLKFAIPAAAALIIAVTIWLVMKRNEGIRQMNAYASIMDMAARKEVERVPIEGSQMKLIFDSILTSKPGADLAREYAALAKATAADGTNIDAAIADFATTAQVPGGVRDKLFEKVIAVRGSAAMVPNLFRFSAGANDPADAYAAFIAIRSLIREEHAEGLLDVIATTDHPKVRQASESEMTRIITESQKRNDLAELISSVRSKSDNPKSSPSFIRLLEQCKPTGLAKVQTPGTQPQIQPAAPQAQAPSASAVIPTSFGWGGDTFIGTTSILDPIKTGLDQVIECTRPSPDEKDPLLIYLKFHLAGVDLPAVGKVQLKMYNADTKATGVHTVKIYGLNNAAKLDVWADTKIDITLAPAISDRAKLTLDTTKLTELGTLEVDFDQIPPNAPLPIFTSAALTDFLKTDTDKRVSFIIRTENISTGASSRFGIRSEDYSGGKFAPALIFTPQTTPN